MSLMNETNNRSLLQKSPIKEMYSAQEIYNIKDPTHRSHTLAEMT